MNIPNLSRLKGAFNIGKALVAAHRPEILLATSVVGGVASSAFAAKGGYDARGKIADEEMERVMLKLSPEAVVEVEEQVNNDENRLSTKEKIDLTWKCYVPAGVALVTSVSATTGLHLIHVKEKKALVTAGAIALEDAQARFKAWENETLGVLDDEDVEKLQDRIFENNAGADGTARVVNTDGEIEDLYLVRDLKTGRDIWSNRHRIEDALIEVNNVINGSQGVELNHFYRHAGFGTIPDGINYGWSGSLVSLEWDQTVRDDGRPVRTFRFLPQPEEGYDSAL